MSKQEYTCFILLNDAGHQWVWSGWIEAEDPAEAVENAIRAWASETWDVAEAVEDVIVLEGKVKDVGPGGALPAHQRVLSSALAERVWEA